MTIEKAMDQVLWHYGRAWLMNKKSPGTILNPLAWALYKTWEQAAEEEGPTKEKIEAILTEYGVAFTDVLSDRLLEEFTGVRK